MLYIIFKLWKTGAVLPAQWRKSVVFFSVVLCYDPAWVKPECNTKIIHLLPRNNQCYSGICSFINRIVNFLLEVKTLVWTQPKQHTKHSRNETLNYWPVIQENIQVILVLCQTSESQIFKTSRKLSIHSNTKIQVFLKKKNKHHLIPWWLDTILCFILLH